MPRPRTHSDTAVEVIVSGNGRKRSNKSSDLVTKFASIHHCQLDTGKLLGEIFNGQEPSYPNLIEQWEIFRILRHHVEELKNFNTTVPLFFNHENLFETIVQNYLKQFLSFSLKENDSEYYLQVITRDDHPEHQGWVLSIEDALVWKNIDKTVYEVLIHSYACLTQGVGVHHLGGAYCDRDQYFEGMEHYKKEGSTPEDQEALDALYNYEFALVQIWEGKFNSDKFKNSPQKLKKLRRKLDRDKYADLCEWVDTIIEMIDEGISIWDFQIHDEGDPSVTSLEFFRIMPVNDGIYEKVWMSNIDSYYGEYAVHHGIVSTLYPNGDVVVNKNYDISNALLKVFMFDIDTLTFQKHAPRQHTFKKDNPPFDYRHLRSGYEQPTQQRLLGDK